MSAIRFFVACALVVTLGGCGVFTPEKGLLSSDDVDPPTPPPQGQFEATVISHIACEISDGLWRAAHLSNAANTLNWLENYGAFVTLKLVVEDQSALNPNASFLTPFGLKGAESFTLGIGGSGTANATRTETIQLTFPNRQLYNEARQNRRAGIIDCKDLQKGVLIDSNLKIAQFIYDKAFVASTLVPPNKKTSTSPLSQIQFEINFVASFSGNITPTWKFKRTNVNSSGTLFSATRTDTDDVLITLGPLNTDTRALHNAAVTGTSTGLAIQGLAH
jgi:hypothetical protein